MQSPELDKLSPASLVPDGKSGPEMEAAPSITNPPPAGEAEPGDTQPVSTSIDQVMTAEGAPTQPEVPASSQVTEGASLGETQPSRVGEDGINLPPEIPDTPIEQPRHRFLWVLWAFVAVLVLALIAGGSAYAGYNSAVDQRTRYQSTLVAGESTNQYVLAKQDIALGNFDRARQRLEYIIQIDPNFPDASSLLAFVLAQQRITATPTFMPSPTLTPTPDFRGRDDLFAQAQNQLIGRDWTGTIDTLLLLRKNYPDYMAVKVDDMLYVALRNRGIDKIAQQHDLEGGNYDLTLAERFGPLDTEAKNWRDWADLYIRGASFWDVDWAQAVYYFSQLASAAPGITDSSGWTASNRYMDALLGYGDWFAAQGQWCDAQTQFDTYMALLASPSVEPTAVYVADQCYQQQNPPAPPAPVVTETPATSETPAITETPGPTETQQPQETPTVSP